MIKVESNFEIKAPTTNKELQKIALVISKKEKKIKGIVELNIIGDKKMTELNYQFRGKKYPTDVLSFAWGEEGKVKSSLLGQIYLCYPQIVRQAKEYKTTAKAEMTRMLIHGLLHLVGHDHIKPNQAKKMFALQETAVKTLGYATDKFI